MTYQDKVFRKAFIMALQEHDNPALRRVGKRMAAEDETAEFGQTPTTKASLAKTFSFGRPSYDDNGLDGPPTKALDGPPMGKSSRGRNYNDSGL